MSNFIKLFGIRFGKYIHYELYNPREQNSTSDNVKLVSNIDHFDYKILGLHYESATKLLQNRSDLFVYFEGSKPLGMMWGYRGSCYIRGPGISLVHNDGIVYWFWIYTVPEARGKNVYKSLKSAFFQHYKTAKGFVALVEPSNTIMRREIEKIGFVETKRYFYINFKNKPLIITTYDHKIKGISFCDKKKCSIEI